ncbi:MAG: hypothetical protein JXB07_13140 [Anaerolineae bacterium]|nr:hypothetical protein [Anaerolineae bacterium]
MSKEIIKRRQKRDLAAGRQRVVISILVTVVIIAVLAIVIVLTYPQLPDLALTLQGGGRGRAGDIVPRNTDIWIANTDGTLRFATLFFPVGGMDTPTGEVFTVTSPLVNKAQDILSTKTYGALSANSEILPGTGRGSEQVYEQHWITRDPGSEVYGIEVLIAHPGYIIADPEGSGVYTLSMNAPKQTDYRQVIVAIAFTPGTRIVDVARKSTAGTQKVLRPYRRVEIDGWLVYYFDTTSLPDDQSIRVRYSQGESASPPDVFAIDANR